MKTRGRVVPVLLVIASFFAAMCVARAWGSDLDADRPVPTPDGGVIAGTCAGLPSYTSLHNAVTYARSQQNGGFNLDMWGAIVNRDGIVCAVAFTGNDRGAQWPGSRVISAQKANTANSFSLPLLALLARQLSGQVLVDWLDSSPLAVAVTPCR